MTIRLYSFKIFIYIILATTTMSSCSSKKYLKEGSYLLKNNKVNIKDSKGISKKKVGHYITQQANKTILFGLKFHLGLYNLSPDCDSCWLGNTLKKMGEPPVVFDESIIPHSVRNMKQYLVTQGHYNSHIDDTATYKRYKATAHYDVNVGKPHRLRDIKYNIYDETLREIILSDTLRSLLKFDRVLSSDLLNGERERIETLLRNRGFYSFHRNYITYTADTLSGNYTTNLTVEVAPYVLTSSERQDTLPFRPYRIRNVYVYTNYDVERNFLDSTYAASLDTLVINADSPTGKVYMLYHNDINIRPGIINYLNNINPGNLYNERRVRRTYDNFSEMRIFRTINIQFDDSYETLRDTLVDCVVMLIPSRSQGYKIALDASSNSSGLFGLSPTLTYTHRNLFDGAEWLRVGFSGNFLRHFSNTVQRSTELSTFASIGIPRFLFPYAGRYFRVFSPRTEFAASYTYQLRPEYTRNFIALSYAYNWRTSRQLSYIMNLLNANIVRIYNMSPVFYQSLRDPYLRNRYENHFVLGSSGSVIYTNRPDNSEANSYYLRWNVAIAGNLLNLFNNALKYDAVAEARLIWNVPYSQYAKTDINFSYYQVFDRNNTLAYRIFAGIGRGYGNSLSLPFEEVYFAGGAYSLRGWQARTVGPGAASLDTTFSIPNQVGELKLEANLEYRYNIFFPLEGALFYEAGNVWLLKGKTSDPETVFNFTDFYRQIAMNTGIGFRLNLNFAIIRLDWGFKVHDPLEHRGWVSPSKWLKRENNTLHIGIGYSF